MRKQIFESESSWMFTKQENLPSDEGNRKSLIKTARSHDCIESLRLNGKPSTKISPNWEFSIKFRIRSHSIVTITSLLYFLRGIQKEDFVSLDDDGKPKSIGVCRSLPLWKTQIKSDSQSYSAFHVINVVFHTASRATLPTRQYESEWIMFSRLPSNGLMSLCFSIHWLEFFSEVSLTSQVPPSRHSISKRIPHLSIIIHHRHSRCYAKGKYLYKGRKKDVSLFDLTSEEVHT